MELIRNKEKSHSVNKKKNLRTKIIWKIILMSVSILIFYLFSFIIPKGLLKENFTQKNLPPSFEHLFGTDWLGRDMFFRTMKGLSTSMTIGIVASVFSSMLAVIFGLIAAAGPKWIDGFISGIIDLIMGIPQLIFLILISFSLGGGIKGVMAGIIVTHWTSLARLVRGEVKKIRNEEYVLISKNLGKNTLWVMRYHFLPHIVPTIIIGIILTFPHAILHESSLSFLGFGLSPQEPSIGIILSESMRYLVSKEWWLTFFPGACLTIIVLLFVGLGENLKKALDPYEYQS